MSIFKWNELILLPTTKTTRIIRDITRNNQPLQFSENGYDFIGDETDAIDFYDIFVVSGDEDINVGDVYLYNENHDANNPKWKFRKCSNVSLMPGAGVFYDGNAHIWCKKIVISSELISNDITVMSNNDIKKCVENHFDLDKPKKVLVEYEITSKGIEGHKTSTGLKNIPKSIKFISINDMSVDDLAEVIKLWFKTAPNISNGRGYYSSRDYEDLKSDIKKWLMKISLNNKL